MRTFADLQEQLRKNHAEFLRIDLETALTLTRIAQRAGAGSIKRQRTVRKARRAYDTVVKMRSSCACTAAEGLQIDKKIRRLRTELLRLGETFA